VAVYCRVLQWQNVAESCNVLQSVATCCRVLQSVTEYFRVKQGLSRRLITVMLFAIFRVFDLVECVAVCCSAL